MSNEINKVNLKPKTVESGKAARATVSYECAVDTELAINGTDGFEISPRSVPLSASLLGTSSFDLTITRDKNTPKGATCTLDFVLLNTSSKQKEVKVK